MKVGDEELTKKDRQSLVKGTDDQARGATPIKLVNKKISGELLPEIRMCQLHSLSTTELFILVAL
jgi:hypothetical protein